jgi:hypothetical protein
MGREITLDGAEKSIVKALGASSSETDGLTLLECCADLEAAEVIDAIKGLMTFGYVESDSRNFHSSEEMAKVNFRLNSGYSKDLIDSLEPKKAEKKSKRVRRE